MIALEWRKAIIILIVSFISLNLILATNIWYREKPSNYFNLTENQQSQIEKLLEQRNVKLKADMPEEGRAQAFLEIRFKPIDEKKALEDFFGKNAKPQIEDAEGSKSYTLDGKQLIITDNGELTYHDNKEGKAPSTITEEKARKEAESFLKSHGGIPEQAVLSNITYDDLNKGYLLEYNRYYEDFLIANSNATVLVTPSGVKMYHQCWMDPIGDIGKKRSVISPLTAIMRVVSEIKTEDPFVISDIEQGFYSKLYNADRLQAAPVWKVALENGDVYYVNAYTGEMEQ